jgi:AraC-like DNA-binding protein
VAVELIARAENALGDPLLGLHAAEHVRPGDFDALELMARASRTVRDALDGVGRYIRLMHDGASVTRVVDPEVERWVLEVPDPAPRHAYEFSLASIVVAGRSVVGSPEGPKQVVLAAPPPEDTREHERIFGCPVVWNGPHNALVYDKARLDKPRTAVNPALALAIEQHAARLLASLSASTTFATRVREQIAASISSGSASTTDIAARMHMSERTLRRRLKECDSSFSDLLSDVRRDLAARYLGDPDLSIAEVAFLLGFADTSSFQRAFRRWYGEPPSAFRARSRAQ